MAEINKAFRTNKGISLRDEVGLFYSTNDPSATNEVAPEGSILLQKNAGNGILWIKTGSADDAWKRVSELNLGDLEDVTISSLATNQLLRWNGSNFENATVSLNDLNGTLSLSKGGLGGNASGFDGTVIISGGLASSIKNNYSATSAPTSTNDSSENYSIGSTWIDTNSNGAYICVDNTAGAAVWATSTSGSFTLAGDSGTPQTITTGDTLTVAGTTDVIDTVAGATGTITVDISSNYTGQTSITTLGTISAGTWEGTTIAVDQGGTGQTTYTDGQLLIGNSTGNTLTKGTLASADSSVTITNGNGTIDLAVNITNLDHSSLSGLTDDDHTQYLLVNGSRAMGGSLDMSTYDITNVGTVDGVDISAHVADTSIHFTQASISITASQVSDFDTEVSNNPSVVANTAKVGFTDVLAQDAVGTILSNEFTYNDTTPSISLNYTNISHTSLQDIGTNTHAQIDTHIADATLHFTEASIDHGSINGLGDDDHTQYLLVSGTRAMSGALDMGTNNITNVGTVDGVDISSHVGDSSIHFTQASISITASQVSDFDTEVSNNPSVVANTAKVGFADELAQDAVGGILSNEFTYTDEPVANIALNYTNISHTSLQDIGTNSHAQIDTHIADGTLHFTQASITTVGTIDTGTWQGDAISEIYGGTNQTSYTIGDTLYASASNTLSKLSIGSSGTFLKSNGTIPSWGALLATEILPVIGTALEDISGFPETVETTLAFVDGTRTFTIAPTGVSFDVYVSGTLYTKTSENIVIPDTTGLHFIYFDTTGTIQSTTIFSDDILGKYAFIAAVYWNATTGAHYFIADERHGYSMTRGTHRYLHNAVSAVYEEGFALTVNDVDGNGDDDSDAQIAYGAGIMWDEDIRFEYTDGSPQDLDPIAQIPVYYRSGTNGDWIKLPADDYPLHNTGTGRVAWNEDTGATWQLTEVSNNDFVLYHYFATDEVNEPIIAIMGQAEYATASSARDGAIVELNNLVLGALQVLAKEFVPLQTIIWQTSTGYTGTAKARVVSTDTGAEFIDWRSTTISNGGISGNDHGGLTGLDDDDHTQYLLVDGTRAMSGSLDMGTNNITNVGTVDGVDVSAHAGDSTIHFTQASISITASQVSDFDTEVSNNPDVVANAAKIGFTDELAQDAVGGILSNEFTYDDGTPSISLNYTNISHTSLQDIGTNSHAQIDTHIADTSLHFTEASIDHGSIGGLTDDDHTQYALLAGRSGGQTLIGGSAASDTLTLQSTSNATRGTVNSVDDFVIGGGTSTSELRLLEASGNGTNYTGFKSPDSLAANVVYTLPSASGSAGQTLTWNASNVLTWETAAGSGTMNSFNLAADAGTPETISDSDTLTISGTTNVIETTVGATDTVTIDISDSYVGQTSITTLGTVSTGTWEGTTIAVDQGGTGQTSYTNGQLLIGNTTGNTLSLGTLASADSTITITNGTGTIDLAVNEANVDHGSLAGLTDDDHTQYALLAGRLGGQTLIGGTAASNSLTLQSTSNATRGTINLVDDVLVGGGTSPSELRLLEGSASGSNYTGFKSPTTLASNVVYELPDASGTAGQVMAWSSGDVLEWVDRVSSAATNEVTTISVVSALPGTPDANTLYFVMSA